MNIKNNILNYLYDRNDVFCFYDDKAYIFNYKHLDLFNEKKIVISLNNKVVTLEGENMLIIKITKEELLIKGIIKNILMKGLHE